MAEVKRQKWYYERKANVILLEPGDLVLAKADAYKEKRKVKDQWEEGLYKVVCKVTKCIPFYEEQVDKTSMSPLPKLTFPHCPYRGHSTL